MTSTDNDNDNDDKLLINYNDACIYGRDLRLLDDRHAWLNDACIHYQFMRLQSQFDAGGVGVLFLDPSVISFFMHQCQDEDEIEEFCQGYDRFASQKTIFIPVNDNLTRSLQETVPGKAGTHWSLLVAIIGYTGSHRIPFLHFDSVQTSGNGHVAKAVATKFSLAYYDFCCRQQHQSQSRSSFACLQECKAPHQANGYDCGVHVLAVAEILAKSMPSSMPSLARDDDDVGISIQQCCEKALQCNSFDCETIRKQIAQDIRQRVAAEQHK